MKRQIRRCVFETNSSSTHAICIAKDGYELKDHIDFHTGEYGWECEEYGDLDNKASYLITAILSMEKEYADEKLMQLKSILDDNNITYTIPEPNIKQYKYDGKTHRYYDTGYDYIDHVEKLKSWLDDLLLDSDKLLDIFLAIQLLSQAMIMMMNLEIECLLLKERKKQIGELIHYMVI